MCQFSIADANTGWIPRALFLQSCVLANKNTEIKLQLYTPTHDSLQLVRSPCRMATTTTTQYPLPGHFLKFTTTTAKLDGTNNIDRNLKMFCRPFNFFSFFNAAHTRHRYASQAGQNSKKKIDTKVYTLLAWRRQTWRLIDFCCFLVLFVAINFAMKKDKNSNILFTAFSF